MIYAYKYLPHKIENFNSNIAHFFEQLFKNDLAIYDENILLAAEFIPIVNKSPVSLKNNLSEITRIYHLLPDTDKQVLQNAFCIAKDIENLCTDTTINLVKFDEIHVDIRNLLKAFSVSLWEDFPQNQLVENAYGQVQEHFQAFTSSVHQKALICPFCGLHKLKPSGAPNRDAYDHYIPKAFYPFISINFKNLFPICHECNSDEKKTTDTLYDGINRERVFYPFDSHYQANQLSVVIKPSVTYNPSNLKTLLNDIDWKYAITLAGRTDSRLTSWDRIFHIQRRYRENIVVYQIEWFEQLLEKYKRELVKGTSFENFKKEIIDEAKSYISSWPLGILRYVYFNFLFSISDFEEKFFSFINKDEGAYFNQDR
ncbi:MAG TPA: hypothetical protein VLB84_21095 [Bacteroidia bacterium]|nr:hypothetical protein [Bacteroidia bacterium]